MSLVDIQSFVWQKESLACFTSQDVFHEFALGRVWNDVLHDSDVAIVCTEECLWCSSMISMGEGH